MAGNKFFATRESAGHQRGYDHIHFATNLDRTLSLDEARELVKVLTDLLDDKKPEAEPATEAKSA